MGRAEQQSLKAYPVKKEWIGNQYGEYGDVNADARTKYQEGYRQAEKDIALTNDIRPSKTITMEHYPTQLDEIDQWLFDSFGIVAGACSSIENLRYNTAKMIAEALWPKGQTFTHHEDDESLQEAVTHQMEDDQVVDDYVRRGLDDVVLKYAQLGANWQKEQLRDLCYQCEKNGETIYYNGMKHAVEQMKKEAIEARVFESSNPISEKGTNCHTISLLYDETPNMPHIICGDKVKFYIFKDNKE